MRRTNIVKYVHWKKDEGFISLAPFAIACLLGEVGLPIALAQSEAATRPAFATANVCRHAIDRDDADAPQHNRMLSGGVLADGRLEAVGVTMLWLIQLAYEQAPDRVTGGPQWIDSDRFDISAKPAEPAHPSQARTMLRTLLADRFGLDAHKERRTLPTFALVAGRNLKLKRVEKENHSGCRRIAEEGRVTYACANVTMADLAAGLQRAASAYLPYPLRDQTNMEGNYTFTLHWIVRGQAGGPSADSALGSLVTELEKETGLRIERRDEPADVLVVDHVNRTPAGGFDKPLSGGGSEAFDAAVIKPVKEDAEEGIDWRTPGHFNATLDLKSLMMMAYNVRTVERGPKWVDRDLFEVTARVPRQTPYVAICSMLRNLLVEEFGLQVHREQRLRPVYVLVPQKGGTKLAAAPAANRSGCKFSDGATRTLACTNITVQQLVEDLLIRAPGYFLERKLVDGTGLEGNYDLVLRWGPKSNVRVPDESGGARGTAEGGQDLFNALKKQLGLAVREEKRPMPIIVIDAIERRAVAEE
jgi:uncharacterized protein (TIGR03435 family)